MNALRTLSIVAGVVASLVLAGCPPAPAPTSHQGGATGAGTMHDQGTAPGQGTMHDRGAGSGPGMMNGQGAMGSSGAPMPHGAPQPPDAK
jgi:hypothetical protein